MPKSNFAVEANVPADALLAMQSGLEQLNLPDVSVDLPANFAARVQELTGYASYDIDRGSGTVGAKTIVGVDGTSSVLVNWAAVSDLPYTELRRLLAHEACHVVMNNRAETMEILLVDVSATASEQGMLQLAFVAMEEYRAEHALFEKGFAASAATSSEHIDDALFDFLGSVILATTYGAEPARMHQLIGKAVDSLTKPLAYLSAVEVAAAEPAYSRVTETSTDTWNDFVEPCWGAWIAALKVLPNALEPLDLDTAKGSLAALAEVMRLLFQCAGFEYVDGVEGLEIYSTSANLKFEDRLARYTAQANAH